MAVVVVVVVEVSMTVTVTCDGDITCGRTILGREEVAGSSRSANKAAALQRQVLAAVGRDASFMRVLVVLKSGGGDGDCRIGNV